MLSLTLIFQTSPFGCKLLWVLATSCPTGAHPLYRASKPQLLSGADSAALSPCGCLGASTESGSGAEDFWSASPLFYYLGGVAGTSHAVSDLQLLRRSLVDELNLQKPSF